MDTNKHLDYGSEIDYWADKYEAALKRGVFDDDKNGSPNTSPQTSTNSFFGLTNTNASESPKDTDSQYWNKVAKLANNEMLNEDAAEVKDTVDAVAKAANPIRHASVGVDQELEPRQLGNPIDPEDVAELAELKIKLHDLQDQLNRLEGKLEMHPDDTTDQMKPFTKGNKAFGTKISKVKDQIEELSNTITTGFQISQQGD